ncbi:YkvA family protein [Spirochaeta cellobiosiphila]|uniref:YkvA family protein n=1 Tax=Spirochaeta cellobiosiphila TaxID=504483 RepID=UPI000417F459
MASAHPINDLSKLEEEFKKSQRKAKKIYRKPEEVHKVLKDSESKAYDVRDKIESVWEYILLFIDLVKNWVTQKYDKIPGKSIISIIAGLLYFVSPIDLIPDMIPVIGYLDDIFVIGLVVKAVKHDLEAYKHWLEEQKLVQ